MMVYEFAITSDFISYIINNDDSLFDHDIGGELKEQIDCWLSGNTKELGAGHYSPLEECSGGDLIGGFMICDVTGVYAHCVLVEYVVM